ncbi:MAG: sigma-70 family RNA polymerase sigma factor [Verrucomicrobia bacterium]|nr:sigma-70 family RNA polymerase sigma factor [Verrucomicrobiota bacterium]
MMKTAALAHADGYDALIRYVRQSGASVEPLDPARERPLRQNVARFRRFLAELLAWPQFRQNILIEMQLMGLPARRQGISEDEAIQSLLIEQHKDIVLGVLGSFTGNITSRQARHILFQIGAEDDVPAARRRWLLPHELVALFDTLRLHVKRDYRRYKAAQTDLFFAHVRMVYDLAAKAGVGPYHFHDAFQEGCVALLHVIDKTADSPCRLSTCAHEWIRGAIKRFQQGERYPVHVPINVISRLGGEFGLERVALDAPPQEIGTALRDAGIEHPAELMTRQELRPLLFQLFECLTDKQRQVIVLRYGLGPDGIEHSLEDAARIIGVSFQEVDRREKRAFERVHSRGSPALLRELALCLT